MMMLVTMALAGPATWSSASGVSLRFPEEPGTGAIQQKVMLYWAGDAMFVPNLNVMDQQFAGGIGTFWSVSEQQFAAMGLTVVSHTDVKVSGKPGARFEYSGPMNGQNLHWAALAVDRGNNVIVLATCTATEAQWAHIAPLCKQALDSMTVP